VTDSVSYSYKLFKNLGNETSFNWIEASSAEKALVKGNLSFQKSEIMGTPHKKKRMTLKYKLSF
jgi:hypothetical protein